MNWKRISSALTGAILAATVSAGAAAQDYPNQPIKFVVWSSAGSPLDTMMRQLGKQVSEVLGQDVPVENRTGGSGAVAMAYVKSQPADAHTVLSTTASMTFTMAKGNVPFTPDDFMMLRAVQAEPSAVAVRADSPFENFEDVVEQLKENPAALKVGGYASAGFHQFVFYRLQQEGKFPAAWIPFDGGNEAALALLGGHIDVAVMTPSSAQAQIDSGEIKLLGISTAERDEYFPDVPTFKEQGYNVVESIWRGVMVASDTPQDRVEVLLSAIDEVQSSQEWKDFMKANMQSSLSMSSEELQEQVRSEVDSRRRFLKENGYLN
ncbi:MAG TPA: tripartite tricarboxylate transporter substrate binding protein [Alphaproteobacteria bacterium]|nr:tripartite tricarboxylate transporter substrate binding protein [Alphaproteobacteria bacterium]